MKKVLFGAILGAAATAIVIKMNEEGRFDGLYESANRLIDRTKAKVRETWEYTREEAEFLAAEAREKAEYYERMALDKAASAARKVEEISEVFADRLEEKSAEVAAKRPSRSRVKVNV